MPNPSGNRVVFTGLTVLVLCLFGSVGCGLNKSCHEKLMRTSPLADTLFRRGDSADFHKSAFAVIKHADCVLSGSSSEAHKLDAKVAKGVNEMRISGWACHSRVDEMQAFHAAIKSNADNMSEAQWEAALATWVQMEARLEADHRAAFCMDLDRERLDSMQVDFLAWRTVNALEEVMEEAGKALEGAVEEGLRFIEDLLGE